MIRLAAGTPSVGSTAATRLTPPLEVSPISTTRRTPCWRTAIARSRRSPGSTPSIRSTTTPSAEPAAISAARPVASCERIFLISNWSALTSSSLRCTPSTTSPVVPTSSPILASWRSSCWSSDTEEAPVIASMRRRLEPIDDSLVTFSVPMSPVALTCVPPHSSIDGPASSTRTMSPYLSPKNEIAPIASASSLVVSKIRARSLRSVSALTSCSISSISSGVTDS